MVLPELRALANRSGVKGTSGMRKSELIAAIRETRQGGHANGASPNGGAGGESDNNHDTKAANSHSESAVEDAPRIDSGERPSSGDNAGEQDHRNDKKQQNENDKPARDQQDRSDDRESNKDSDRSGDRQGSGGQQNRGGSNQNQQDDDGDGRGGRRGRRFRERRRRGDRPGDGGGAMTPNSAKTTSFSRSPASSTCSTITRSYALPVISPARTTSTYR